MIRFGLPLLLAASLLPSAAHAADLPNPLGLRGFNLGMTLDEMRRQKFPDPTTDEVRLICTGDKLADDAGLNPAPGREADDIGTKTCGFFAVTKRKVREASMIVGGPEAKVTFLITPNSTDAAVSERLYCILVSVKSVHFPDLNAAYVAKFGPPHSRLRPPDRDMSWESEHASLFFLDLMEDIHITYTDTKLDRMVDALTKNKGKLGADKL